MQYNLHKSLIMYSVQLPYYKTSTVAEADFGKLNLKNMLKYELKICLKGLHKTF